MLQIRKPIGATLDCQEVTQIIDFHIQLKKNKVSELKEDILLVSPGLSGRQVKLNQIARYDE